MNHAALIVIVYNKTDHQNLFKNFLITMIIPHKTASLT